MGAIDHLRSVGRQRKPVGEGQSLLDSVLQRDRKKTEGVTKNKIGNPGDDGDRPRGGRTF